MVSVQVEVRAEGRVGRRRVLLHLDPEVIARLQLQQQHPGATLLYLWLLTSSVVWTNEGGEVRFASEGHLLEALQDEAEWYRIYPLLRLCLEDLDLQHDQRADVVTSLSLKAIWGELMERTYREMRRRRGWEGMKRKEEEAFKLLLTHAVLAPKLIRLLAPVLSEMPGIGFGRQEAWLWSWIGQLQGGDWEVVEAELAWLTHNGLLDVTYQGEELAITLVPEGWWLKTEERAAQENEDDTDHANGADAADERANWL